MAKARQVGTPHSLQLVLGNSLKIWIPVSPMIASPFQLQESPLPWREGIYCITRESGPWRGRDDSSLSEREEFPLPSPQWFHLQSYRVGLECRPPPLVSLTVRQS